MVIIMVVRSITNDLFEIHRMFWGLYDFIILLNTLKYPVQNYGTRQRKADCYACRHECG
jgi:hypothetical protein